MSADAEAQAAQARELWLLLAATAALLIWSGIAPFERGTWLLEVGPVLIGVPILIATRRRFPLSLLLYRLLFVHAVILIIGGHYTYARVPAGHWLQELFDLSRNHYDRLGHLVQGFVPAILAREILLRRSPLCEGRWLAFIVICICLAFSAFYELLEWWAALIGGTAADGFLGAQGDIWDSQWDMLMALIGAGAALLTVAGAHTRSMRAHGLYCAPPAPRTGGGAA